jgi:hypothetical protein
MKSAWAVTRLELGEWRALPVLALAAGLVAMVGVAVAPNPDIRELAAQLPGLACIGVWLVAGGSVFTRDVREGRAHFLLSRPTSEAAVWLGKLGAALTIAWVAYALSVLPLASWNALHGRLSPERTIWGLPMLMLACVGIGHWGALAFTARGWRLLADAGLAVGLLAAIAALYVRVWIGGALVSPRHLAFAWPAALLLASLAAITRGRGDRVDSYSWFTRVHWTCLAVAALFLGGVLQHIRSFRPSDLRHPSVVAVSPQGDWLAVSGQGWTKQQGTNTLLVSPGNGDFLNAGRDSFWGAALGFSFSADGRWCAWSAMHWSAGEGLKSVTRLARLGSREPVVTLDTPVQNAPSRDSVTLPTLSPTGKGLLLAHGAGHVEVRSPADPTAVWSRDHVDSAGFLDDDTVWVLARGPKGRSFVTFGRARGELRGEVTLGGEGQGALLVGPGAAFGLVLAREGDEALVERCDLVRGGCQSIWSHLAVRKDEPGVDGIAAGGILQDGGFVVVARENASPDGPWLARAFDSDGRPRWTVATPSSRSLPHLVGEPAPGTLLVQLRTWDAQPADPFPVLLLDTATGQVLRRETGFAPLGTETTWTTELRRGLAATYFVERSGRLVRLHTSNAQREVVLDR